MRLRVHKRNRLAGLTRSGAPQHDTRNKRTIVWGSYETHINHADQYPARISYGGLDWRPCRFRRSYTALIQILRRSGVYHHVDYRVTGSARVSYTNETGGLSTGRSFDDVPFQQYVIFTQDGLAWISAQNERSSGSVNVEILVDTSIEVTKQKFEVVKRVNCEGEYCIAEAKWSAE